MTPSSIRPTRFTELGYREDAPRCWRFVDLHTTASIGPQHATRGELLANLPQFAAEFGCAGAGPRPTGACDHCTATREERSSGPTQPSRDWDAREDARLYELVLRGHSSASIAQALHRTGAAIRARCRRLSILPHRPPCNAGDLCERCDEYHQHVSTYWDVLHDAAPELEDALRALVVEVQALPCRDRASVHAALRRAEHALRVIDVCIERRGDSGRLWSPTART